MAYATLPGQPMSLIDATFFTPPLALSTGGLIDATGEKIAWLGPVWLPGKSTTTKDIERICFRFGTITKAGGSALTLSLQNIDATTGPRWVPDETQDQTVAIANGDAAFASNTWYRSGTLSANRTVSHGELLAVVLEYDGGGRLGADAVRVTNLETELTLASMPSSNLLKTGGSWGVPTGQPQFPNLVLEMSDGTFGTLLGGLPCTAASSQGINVDSATRDEIALKFRAPFPFGVEMLGAMVDATTGDFDLVLYEGTTQIEAVTIDANQMTATTAAIVTRLLTAIAECDADTDYYLAVKPTTTTNVTVYYVDVDDANHLSLWPGGTNWVYAERIDSGAWSPTTTRRLIAHPYMSSFSDGSGGGGPLCGYMGMP